MDRGNTGYISIDQLFTYIDERNYSIVAPYLERFFDLIDRSNRDRIATFEELLPALAAFCLFSKDEMITCKKFKKSFSFCIVVFNMYDIDRDGEISKRDLFRMFTIVKENIQVFPINNMRAVELIPMERGDKITKMDFVDIVHKLPYTIFPSFRL